MSGFDDLFSPEALRILDEFCNGNRISFEPDETSLNAKQTGYGLLTLDTRDSNSPHTQQTFLPSKSCFSGRVMQDRKRKIQEVPGSSTLAFSNFPENKRKRAKFDPKGRRKVAAVRKKGACMRCRILKIPVRVSFSITDVCTDGSNVVLRGMAMQVLH